MTTNPLTGYKVLTMTVKVEVLVRPGEDSGLVFNTVKGRLFDDLDVSDEDILSFIGPLGYEERPADAYDLAVIGETNAH